MKIKILFIDIETSPHLGYSWGKYEQDILSFKRQGYLLCFAYKWLGEKTVHAKALPDFPKYRKHKEDDTELVKALWKLFDKADIVIAHNGDQFDIKMANAYFAHHKLKPPSPFRTVDTKKAAKAAFRFVSNKLDDLGQYLGLGRKLRTGGMDLWFDCMAGDMKAWNKMVSYNKQDIVLLEKVYYQLRPWIKSHANVNMLDKTIQSCPNCGSGRLQSRGFGASTLSIYNRFQCQDCGHWCRGKPVSRELIARN